MIHTIYISREFTFRISARPESRPAGRCKKDVSDTSSEVGGWRLESSERYLNGTAASESALEQDTVT